MDQKMVHWCPLHKFSSIELIQWKSLNIQGSPGFSQPSTIEKITYKSHAIIMFHYKKITPRGIPWSCIWNFWFTLAICCIRNWFRWCCSFRHLKAGLSAVSKIFHYNISLLNTTHWIPLVSSIPWQSLKCIKMSWNQFEIHFLPAHGPEARRKTKTVSDQTNSYCMILHANFRKDAKTSTLQKPSENQYQLQKSTQLPWHNVSPVAGFQGNSLRTSATQDTWSTASAWGADAAPGSVPFALSEELWWNPLPEAFQPHLQISFHPHSI